LTGGMAAGFIKTQSREGRHVAVLFFILPQNNLYKSGDCGVYELKS
jgi:hypothetical protein